MSTKPRKAAPTKTAVRCAVYTRKSTEEGLEQEFNSLDARRESGENYIKAQVEEGWECLPDRYDDGGYSGGNMERPALQRLLADVKAGKVDCIVVYKVDRLRRQNHWLDALYNACAAGSYCGVRLVEDGKAPRRRYSLIELQRMTADRPTARELAGLAANR